MKAEMLLHALVIALFGVGCREAKKYTLADCNAEMSHGYYVPRIDTSVVAAGATYYFAIRHDRVRDLSRCRLGISINDRIVYWGKYRELVQCRFNKVTDLNELAIYLRDSASQKIYSWDNKEVYDFDSALGGCTSVKLFSDVNKDYGNLMDMEVY